MDNESGKIVKKTIAIMFEKSEKMEKNEKNPQKKWGYLFIKGIYIFFENFITFVHFIPLLLTNSIYRESK